MRRTRLEDDLIVGSTEKAEKWRTEGHNDTRRTEVLAEGQKDRRTAEHKQRRNCRRRGGGCRRGPCLSVLWDLGCQGGGGWGVVTGYKSPRSSTTNRARMLKQFVSISLIIGPFYLRTCWHYKQCFLVMIKHSTTISHSIMSGSVSAVLLFLMPRVKG